MMTERPLVWGIAALAGLLLVTNLLWLNFVLGTNFEDARDEHEVAQLRRTVDQALRLMPVLDSQVSRSELISTAERQSGTFVEEKDGCSWAHELGFKFDEQGSLIHVTSRAVHASADPCFRIDNP